jgi:hypothetical protein
VNDLTPQTLGESPSRQRDAALQAARVQYRTEHGRWPSRSWNLMADPAPSVPLKSIEREAWDRAYAGPEVGPLGGTWPEDGRHVPYMRWRLPYSTGR